MKMRNLCLNSSSIRLAVFLSLSFSSYSFPPFFFSPKPRPSLRLSLSSSPPATAGEILSLLGPEEQASEIDSDEAQQLWSCLKFLVPFRHSQATRRRSMVGRRSFNGREDEENELIWRPPAPVLELARLAVDSGGDRDAIHRALDPSVIPVTVLIGDPIEFDDLLNPQGIKFASRGSLYDAVSSRIGYRLQELKLQVDTLALEQSRRVKEFALQSMDRAAGILQQVDWEAFGMDTYIMSRVTRDHQNKTEEPRNTLFYHITIGRFQVCTTRQDLLATVASYQESGRF